MLIIKCTINPQIIIPVSIGQDCSAFSFNLIIWLKLKGVDFDEEQTISEPELLEIMEIREAGEEAADSQALTEIQIQKLKHWAECFARAFQDQNFEEAKSSIHRMTYYERVNKEIVKML
ncbi:unnamed protein product [Rhodiola kirilowii]